jgi:hypothetical protein
MRIVRLATAFAVVASLGTGTVSHAAAVTCNLLTDPAGDVTVKVPQYGPMPYADPAVDIRSADVVSDATGLGINLRVAGIGGVSASSTHTDLGVENVNYFVFLTIESSGRELIFDTYGLADNAAGMAYGAAGGQPRFEVGRYLNDSIHKYASEYYIPYGAARGTVDTAKSEIRAWVSWADLKKYGYTHAKRDRVVKVRARAMDYWLSASYEDTFFDPASVRYEGAPRDEATATRSYVLGARSCAAKP